MNKPFSEVFQKLNMPSAISKCFKDALVTNLHYSETSRNIDLGLLLKDYQHTAQIPALKTELLGQFPGLTEVSIHFQVLMPEPWQEAHITNIIKPCVSAQIQEEHPLFGALLSNAQWQLKEDKLEINLGNASPYFLLKKSIHKRIEQLIESQFGYSYGILFKHAPSDFIAPVSCKPMPAPTQQKTVSPAPLKKEPRKVVKAGGNQLLGKKISGQLCKLSEAVIEGETLILEGAVLSVSAREIKGGKYLVCFDITDQTDAITAKCFLTKETYQGLSDRLLKGKRLRIRGILQYDRFARELNIMARDIELLADLPKKMDMAPEKRIELHLHSQMSQMDGVTPVGKYIERAAAWGHEAIAITDHGVVQAFPDAYAAAKKHNIKIIYGVEAYLVDNLGSVVQMPGEQTLDDTFVVFDIETTGLSKEKEKITEIGAVKVVGGTITDTFSTFVNPGIPIPLKITELTGITDEMVAGAPSCSEAVRQLMDFACGSVLVAHNANFDMGFIQVQALKDGYHFNQPVLDTVELSRVLFPELKKHKLDIVCKHLEIALENHHRACDDAKATAEVLIECFRRLKAQQVNTVHGINVFAAKKSNYKKLRAYHAIILAKNQEGLKNLYQLISDAHIRYFFRRPRILKSELLLHKEGLILGSACEAGELYRALLDNKPDAHIEEIANFYDYLEIQPLGNNQFLVDQGKVEGVEDLKEINRKIIALGEKLHKPVVATCDAHFLDPEDEVYRRIIMAGEGFSDSDRQPPLYFRTTEEMLKEFAYLGDDTARSVVIRNPKAISEMVELIKPIPDETFPPEIPGAEDELRNSALNRAYELYGNPLPPVVSDRLERELNSIIKNGFSVMYIIARKLVLKSMADGYLVGSRGSVGSSFAATMAGITEVNPLPPHYRCAHCRYSDFDSPEVKAFAGGSGYDMPDKDCPECGRTLVKDGHDIPFETFLGFDGDKEPDIDLNFSGEYQQNAHAYTEELFGEGNVFKAGTIGTLAEKTAYGYVKKYFDERDIIKNNAEINRLVAGCTGIKRTTGQHPGGLMIVPKTQSIFKFTPVQRPANDMKSSVTTTHFDYHSISGRLLKLDILGHDDPTMIRMLHDLTGIDPQKVPLDDQKTMSLFTSSAALEVTPEQISCETGSLGIPEFGTKFVRQMLKDTKPTTFAELIRISGLSHGTDVWLNNAQENVRNHIATLKDVISTRDDIMVYLIIKGIEKKRAFTIMEKVRKGKGLSEDDITQMKQSGVPEWYIDSCTKIKYMFPKAHAAAYVMMAFRIAYFKVYYPEAYYASYFTVRADDFDYETMCKGISVLNASITEMESKGNQMTAKEKNKLTISEVVREMLARGFNFVPLDLYRSDAEKFMLTEKGILPPFNSLPGLGITAAHNIVNARKDGEFCSVEDIRERTSLSKTVIELLKQNNILQGLPDTSQLSLFG